MERILSNIRVLDFGRYIAGPYAGAMLGDLGADVIRVERPEGGEDRHLFPQSESGDGSTFLQCNRNKRGMTLDVKHPEAQEVMARLVGSADVVIANLPQQTLKSMGLDYDRLTSLKPDIILASVTAFGPEGPYADRVGFDGIGQGMSGSIYMSGFPGQPTKSYASWVDFTTALLTAFGIMAALRERDRTGRGQEVRNNLLKSAMTVTNSLLIDQYMSRPNRGPSGNRGQTGGPVDVFQTADGWIMIQVIGGPLFKRWAHLVGEPGWLGDPRFANDTLRGGNGALISERTAAWCRPLATAEALAALANARLPAGPVLAPQEILDDIHVSEAGFLDYVAYPGAERAIPYVKPTEFSESDVGIDLRPPLLGEHTDQILREIGFDPRQILRIRDSGAI